MLRQCSESLGGQRNRLLGWPSSGLVGGVAHWGKLEPGRAALPLPSQTEGASVWQAWALNRDCSHHFILINPQGGPEPGAAERDTIVPDHEPDILGGRWTHREWPCLGGGFSSQVL